MSRPSPESDLLTRAAVFLGSAAGRISRHSPFRPRTSGPADVLCWLVRTLPHRQGEEIFATLSSGFFRAFGLRVVVIVPGTAGAGLQVYGTGFEPNRQDLEAAVISLNEGLPAGYGTRLAPGASAFFLPLYAAADVVAALGLKAHSRLPGQANPGASLFHAFCGQAVLSVLRANLNEQAQRARMLQEADRLHKALLGSIAHNVRTPIASILGSLSTLREDGLLLDDSTRRDLIDNALTETQRLNRLMSNLLDTGRLEAGALQVRSDPCDVQDVIGAALEQLGAAAFSRTIFLDIPFDLPFVPMDFVFIVQVLVNLLDNAMKYSPENEPITVEAAVLGNDLRIRVIDGGEGIPAHARGSVFEKFNRAGRTGETGGVGLGLFICKGLIEAHHGTIRAEPREPRGSILTFTIPLVERPLATPGAATRPPHPARG